MFIANVEASNNAKVSVSCTIPALLEMNLEPEDIESDEAEIQSTPERLCVQKEDDEDDEDDADPTYESTPSHQLIGESQSENSVVLYSFYER